MTIEELIKESHETALEKGWWDKERTIGDFIALVHSELSEALQEFRSGNALDYVHYDYSIEGKKEQPHGFLIEIADVLIRIADMCGYYGIDLEQALKEKMAYNKLRPHRHGGKQL